MFDFLDNLRSKSHRTRRQIAVGFSAVATLIIFFVWFSLFRAQHDTADLTTSAEQGIQNPLSVLTQNIADTYESLQQNFGSISTGTSTENAILAPVTPENVSNGDTGTIHNSDTTAY